MYLYLVLRIFFRKPARPSMPRRTVVTYCDFSTSEENPNQNRQSSGFCLQQLRMQDLEHNIAMAGGELTWINVGISLLLIIFNIGVSTVFRLGVGLSLLIAALRCVGQLALVAAILHQVFETKNPWLVSLICCAFVLSFIQCFLDFLICCPFLSCFEFLGYF